PASVKRRLDARLAKDFRDLVIVDTAGRLQIDEALMDELAALAEALSPTERVLVVDAMMGQEALGVARAFDERVGVTGLILTKLDGDARGGAALSARHVTGKPIYFAGVSEKVDGLEPFYPDRLADRILGMGDLKTLAEKVREAELKAPEKAPGKFDLEDLLEQMRQIQKMGSFAEILKMIPGLSRALPQNLDLDERALRRVEAIILSMTPEERKNPRILNASRRRRIARGSGTTVQEVNRLIKTYEEARALFKRLSKKGGRRSLMGMFGGRPW
ncbi:MAG TPA: signal recognition particle protein, partial [Oceanithermus sp.]|nr:signal recognition particle protein [Oceanithermus sp.]